MPRTSKKTNQIDNSNNIVDISNISTISDFSATSKKLTISNIQKVHKEIYSQKSIVVNVEGENYTILIDNVFATSKIQNLIIELLQNYNSTTPTLDISTYTIFLLVKYFTDIDIKDIENYEEQIKTFKVMIDLGIVNAIVESFDEKEILKIGENIKKAEQNIKDINSNPELQAELTKMAEQLNIVQ